MGSMLAKLGMRGKLGIRVIRAKSTWKTRIIDFLWRIR